MIDEAKEYIEEKTKELNDLFDGWIDNKLTKELLKKLEEESERILKRMQNLVISEDVEKNTEQICKFKYFFLCLRSIIKYFETEKENNFFLQELKQDIINQTKINKND